MDAVMYQIQTRNLRRLLQIHFKHHESLTQKRFRYKPKWAIHEKPLTNCQQALGNFDAFYKPFYGKEWPSLRISLLSQPKYCAAVNKYGDLTKVQEKLSDIGATDFLLNADISLANDALESLEPSETAAKQYRNEYSEDRNLCNEGSSPSVLHSMEEEFSSTSNDDLNVFVPTEKVYSERDLLLKEEINLNTFESRDISAEVLPPEKLEISDDIMPFVFPQGDVSMFPSPKPCHGILGYYLMDAASVIPVLALNIQPKDRVLDLCAAPGGKSYLILQSLNAYEGGSLHCNDISQSRLSRLRSVLKLYFPRDLVEQVTVTKLDGNSRFHPVYNKVLVDAPCNSDRHVVTEDENNLFKISRTRERLGLTELQRDLLVSAIKSCVPGGTIVYSTCTLSPAQNDGVIQAAIEELYLNSEVEVAVQDLSTLRLALSSTFKFHSHTKHGLTILPTLLNNFGPSYVSKLRRIK